MLKPCSNDLPSWVFFGRIGLIIVIYPDMGGGGIVYHRGLREGEAEAIKKQAEEIGVDYYISEKGT